MYFDDFSFFNNFTDYNADKSEISSDGFLYGNAFTKEYKPYKDYEVYNLKSSTSEGVLKLKIMEETFYINDLSLYLDINPDKKEIYDEFKKHKSNLDELINEYENKFGSICLNAKKDNYTWINGPWPWEDKNV